MFVYKHTETIELLFRIIVPLQISQLDFIFLANVFE